MSLYLVTTEKIVVPLFPTNLVILTANTKIPVKQNNF